jgi:hypothetical protein
MQTHACARFGVRRGRCRTAGAHPSLPSLEDFRGAFQGFGSRSKRWAVQSDVRALAGASVAVSSGRGLCSGALSLTGRDGQSQGLVLGADLAHLGKLLVGGGEADVESVDLTQPAAVPRLAHAIVEVDDDRE